MYINNVSPETLFNPFVLVTTSITATNPSAANCASETTLRTAYGDLGSPNMTTGWALIGKIERPLNVNVETQEIETTDGDSIITSEGVNFSCNDLNFSKVNYEYLRANLHRHKANFILVDPSRLDSSVTVKLTNMPVIVLPSVEEMQKMLITAKRKSSNADDIFSLITLS